MVPSAFNQDIKAIHPKPEIVPQYLLFALRHKINSSENILSNAAHGTLKINSEGLNNVLLAIPSKERQQEIVAIIEALKFETRQLEAIYYRKLIALAELKQSLLQKAFTGELTAENMENEAREAMV